MDEGEVSTLEFTDSVEIVRESGLEDEEADEFDDDRSIDGWRSSGWTNLKFQSRKTHDVSK
jgi:hypothetical protein